MRKVALSKYCAISSGGTPSRKNPEFFKGDIPWAKISDIENAENGYVYATDECISTEGLKNIRGKLFPKGTLLFAMYGSIGKVAIAGRELSTNQAILGIRPKTADQIDLHYLKCWFESNKQKLINQGQGVALKNLSATIVRNLEIELPPLDDQKRIAHLLGKVEGLIARRKQHLQQLDDLLKSVFLEMFGDPVRNEKGWDTVPFHKVGKFISGGTPSKSRDDFWSGVFPWVSPKDMKVSKIEDASDHISEAVFEETSLKRIAPGHLLIVVRGMILAHSFPVAINTVEIAINQDMKAIKPIKGVNVVYLQNCLTSMKRQILKLISTAGHGTRKFDTVAMQKLLIPKPPEDLQNQFAAIVEKVEDLKSRYQQSLTDLGNLYGALSQKAFKGELDLSRIPIHHELAFKETIAVGNAVMPMMEAEATGEVGFGLQKFKNIISSQLPPTFTLGDLRDAIGDDDFEFNKVKEYLTESLQGTKPFLKQEFGVTPLRAGESINKEKQIIFKVNR
jgi:type I restriction enzyme S subunit